MNESCIMLGALLEGATLALDDFEGVPQWRSGVASLAELAGGKSNGL